jgi:hypothetical protein
MLQVSKLIERLPFSKDKAFWLLRMSFLLKQRAHATRRYACTLVDLGRAMRLKMDKSQKYFW